MNPPLVSRQGVPAHEFLETYHSEFVTLSKLVARRFPSLEAEDLLQETALGLLENNWRAESDLRDPTIRALLFRKLLHNMAIKLVERQRAVKRQSSRPDKRLDEKEIAAPVRSDSDSIDFAEKMMRLTPKNRRALAAFLIHGSKAAAGRALHAQPHTLTPDAARMYGARQVESALNEFFRGRIRIAPPSVPKRVSARRKKAV